MRLKRLTLSILMCVLVGSVSGLFINDEIDTWYAALIKPSINPPDWIFAPVWTLLYILMGISFYNFWNAKSDKSKRIGYILFFVQLALNFSWSFFFFNLHALELALAEIVVLIIAIVATIFVFHPFARLAAILLIPYLLWVCFASWLNYQIMVLN